MERGWRTVRATPGPATKRGRDRLGSGGETDHALPVSDRACPDLRAGEVHHDPHPTFRRLGGPAYMLRHRAPLLGFVVGAVDPDQFGSRTHDALRNVRIRRRLTGQSDHDAGGSSRMSRTQQSPGVVAQNVAQNAGSAATRRLVVRDLGKTRPRMSC